MTRRHPLPTLLALLVGAVIAAALFAPGAGAQTGGTSTTTSSTSSSTTSTTEPGDGSGGSEDEPPPTLPAPPTTVEPPPEPPPGEPEEDAEPSEVPTEQVAVPPREGPAPEDPLAPFLEQIALLRLELVQKALLQAQEARALAAVQVESLTARIASLESQIIELHGQQKRAVARFQEARAVMKRRAVASYMGTPVTPLNVVLESEDVGDLSRRLELLGAVVTADRKRADQYDRARRQIGNELEYLVTELDTARSGLQVSEALLTGADDEVLARQAAADATSTGSSIAVVGFRFPVAGPHTYSDTFGAPRMFGTAYAHLHQGADIFAPSGTALVACERGVLIRVGTDTLGGTKLWLVGASGTRYYYAHLLAYADGVHEGKLVEAGETIGYVGNTGNAASTPSHLHFEVHPGGGPAVNPTPLLRLVDDATSEYQTKPPPTR